VNNLNGRIFCGSNCFAKIKHQLSKDENKIYEYSGVKFIEEPMLNPDDMVAIDKDTVEILKEFESNQLAEP